MKRLRLIIIFLLFQTFTLYASGQQHGFGAGLIIGEPTGISLKGWLTAKTAVDVGIAWSFVKETSLHLHADYLMHTMHDFEGEGEIPLYYGIGGRIKIGDNEKARLGLRMVAGLGYMFEEAPFDLFLEIAPILDLVPKTDLSVNAGFGARFYFR